MARQYSTKLAPAPPYSSGISMPRKPSSATACSSLRGQAALRSRSAAVGATTSAATLRAESRIMSSCSPRNAAFVSLMVIPYEFRGSDRVRIGLNTLFSPDLECNDGGCVCGCRGDRRRTADMLVPEQEVRQRRDQGQGAEHVPQEHEGQQDAHVGLELDGL